MKFSHHLGIALTGLCLALLISCNTTIPAPSGPYKVGTTVLSFTDEGRQEPMDKENGPRRFLVRVWYPAQSIEGRKPAVIVDANQAEALVKFMNYPRFMSSEGSTSLSYTDAPAMTGQAWPVIFFEHGGFSMETQNFMFLQEMASQGYVVFALNHPYESLVSEFPDGSVIWANTSLAGQNTQGGKTDSGILKTAGESINIVIKGNKAATTEEERWKALYNLGTIPPYSESRPGLEIRVGDLNYLRQHLTGLNSDGLLRDTMDASRVGLIGHSMGGYTVGETLLRYPDSYAMAVNLDGPQIVWASEHNLRFTKPILFMYSTDLNLGGQALNTDGLNRIWAETSSAPAWEAVIKGMGHFNYTDLGYLSSLKYSGIVGPIDGPRGCFLYTSVARAFTDRYLKGVAAPALDQVPADWPEVTIRSWHLP
jgi:pimeloyl-ACP methyl ester carboxylesterase